MATHGLALPMLGGSLPFLSAKAGNEESRLPPRSPPGPLGAPAAAAGSNQLQVEAPGDGGSILAARCSGRTLLSLLLRGLDRWQNADHCSMSRRRLLSKSPR